MVPSYKTFPVLPDAFRWTLEPWGPVLRCAPLEAVVPHAFTGRHVPMEPAESDQALRSLVNASSIAQASQVHGRDVAIATATGQWPGLRPDADVLVSSWPGIGVAVRAADCVPLLMADRVTGAVAAVHAGWRGTASGAAVAGLNALVRSYGTRPSDVVVAIGPSIGPCCYEVGPELVDAFAAAGHARHLIDRWFLAPAPPRGSRERPPLRLDLVAANRDQLLLAGVDEANVHACGLCTAMHLDLLTSYRAEGAQAVRMMAVIAPWREK